MLTPQEAEALFATLRRMAAEGRTVIFISHKLHEVKAVADRVTVLRGGRTVATVATADATPRELAALMVGREVELAQPGRARGAAAATEPALEVDGLSVRGDRGEEAVRDVVAHRSRRARSSASPASPGTASGSSPRRSPGCGRRRAGSSASAGASCGSGDPRAAIAAGIAHVPEDRLGTGVAPSLSIAENSVLKSYRGRGDLPRAAPALAHDPRASRAT